MSNNNGSKPRPKVVTVTPQKAERWLKNNTVNRHIRSSLVNKYARDMKAGRWKLNGKTLCFAPDGKLIDGQHRLLACVKADVPFTTVISYDVDEDSMDTIDIGEKKTFADNLGELGVTAYQNMVSALTRLTYRYSVLDTSSMSNAELADLFDKHSSAIVESVETCASFRRSGDPPCCNQTAIGLVHMVTKKRNRDLADNYAVQLIAGEGLIRKDPAHSIRAKLMRAKTDRMAIRTEDQVAMMLRGWNALRKGRSYTRVYSKGKGDVGWRDIKVL